MNDKPQLKPYEGAVAVDGDITPITRQPIKRLDSGKWGEMSFDQLWEQKLILSTRLQYVLQTQPPHVIQQFQTGMAELDMILLNRDSGDTGLS